MMRRQMLVMALVAICMFSLCGCGGLDSSKDGLDNSENTVSSGAVSGSAVSPTNSMGFFIEKEKITFKTDDSELQIEVPQFREMRDTNRQKRLNQMIQKKIQKQLDDVEIGKELIEEERVLNTDCEVTYVSSSRISIALHWGVILAHPYYWDTAVNLDLYNETYLEKSDLISDKKRLNQLLLDEKCKVIGEDGFSLRDAKKEMEKDKIKYIWDIDGSWETVAIYMSETGIRVSIPTSYRLGSNAIYEVKSEDVNPAENIYFPIPQDVYEKNYNGTYQAVFKTDKEQTCEVTLDCSPFSENAYNLSIEVPEYDVPPEYLDLGQFYISPSAIYGLGTLRLGVLDENELEQLLFKGKIPKLLSPVCQAVELPDRNSDEDGVHSFCRVRGDEVIYYCYDNSVQNGRYQMYVWKKRAGLVAYRMGFGSAGDTVRIWKEDTLSDESVLTETFPQYREGNGEKPATEPLVTNPYFPYDGDTVQGFSSCEYMVIPGKVNWQTKLLDATGHGTLYQIGFNRIYDRKPDDGDLEIFDGKKNTANNWYMYLWVTENAIYNIDTMTVKEKTELLTSGTLPESASLVCQEQTTTDQLKTDEVGRHESITEFEGDLRNYHSYSINNTSNPEAKSILEFVWKKDVGLIGFRYADTAAGAGSVLAWNEEYLKAEDGFFSLE